MGDFGDAFSPRFRTTFRAATRLALSASIAIAVAGCGNDPEPKMGERIAEGAFSLGGIRKLCDEGRAIYTYRSGSAGGIAIVENAPECTQSETNGGDE